MITEQDIHNALREIKNYLFRNQKEIRINYGDKHLAVAFANREVNVMDSDNDEIELIRRCSAPRGSIVNYTTLDKALARVAISGY